MATKIKVVVKKTTPSAILLGKPLGQTAANAAPLPGAAAAAGSTGPQPPLSSREPSKGAPVLANGADWAPLPSTAAIAAATDAATGALELAGRKRDRSQITPDPEQLHQQPPLVSVSNGALTMGVPAGLSAAATSSSSAPASTSVAPLPGAAAPAVPLDPAAEDVRRKREKLEAWKKKKAAEAAGGTAAAAPAPAPPPPAPPRKVVAPIALPKPKASAVSAVAGQSSTGASPLPRLGLFAMELEAPVTTPDDENNGSSGTVASSAAAPAPAPAPAPSSASSTGTSKHPAVGRLPTDLDAWRAAVERTRAAEAAKTSAAAAAPSSSLSSTSTAPAQAAGKGASTSASQPAPPAAPAASPSAGEAAADELDSFMREVEQQAVAEGAVLSTSENAGGAAAAPKAITMQDLLEGRVTEVIKAMVPPPAAAAAAPGPASAAAGSGSSNQRDGDVTMGNTPSSSEATVGAMDADADNDSSFIEHLRKHGLQPPEPAAAPLPEHQAVSAELHNDAASDAGNAAATVAAAAAASGEADDDEATLFKGEEWDGITPAQQAMMKPKAPKKLERIKPGTVEYIPLTKDLYVPHKDVLALPQEEVERIRKSLEIHVRGKNIPNPIETWEHAGLPDQLLEALKARGMRAPFAIQRQALPVIMSGRDIIGVAKTGSGKTLAYLIPLFRHILVQPPLEPGDGPIGLVMAPSRELVNQIFAEARKLAKAHGPRKGTTDQFLRVTAVTGGEPVKDQIANLKRGSEIVVCTPGRMIDILTMNASKLISMARVSYVVLDEADRMFDMGFEPQTTIVSDEMQIATILSQIRPDRQMVMFSATFPQHVEALAKKALKTPIEVVVGGRSIANKDVEQHVLVVPEQEKFSELLRVLGQFDEKNETDQILIFVDTQGRCDDLFDQLRKNGWASLSLHGGVNQADRDSVLDDFKKNIIRILVATSVAGRGLDVPTLGLVVNYSCPNHIEDYIHRIGRTGRAGRKGLAYTFITPNEAQYARDLIKALTDAEQPQHIPEALTQMAQAHEAAVAAGTAKHHSSGFSNAKGGYKFTDDERSHEQALRDVQRLSTEVALGIKTLEDATAEEESKRVENEEKQRLEESVAADKEYKGGAAADIAEAARTAAANAAAEAELAATLAAAGGVMPDPQRIAFLHAQVTAARVAMETGTGDKAALDAATKMLVAAQRVKELMVERERARLAAAAAAATAAIGATNAGASGKDKASIAAQIASQLFGAGAVGAIGPSGIGMAADGRVVGEIEINDAPQQARYKVQARDGRGMVEETHGVIVNVRGSYWDPAGPPLPPGERKLYLEILAPDEVHLSRAKNELRRILEAETARANLHALTQGIAAPNQATQGRYSVV